MRRSFMQLPVRLVAPCQVSISSLNVRHDFSTHPALSTDQLLYPLDQVRHLQQTGECKNTHSAFGAFWEVARSRGVSAMYDGILATQVALAASNFVFFFFSQVLKDLFRTQFRIAPGQMQSLLVNAAAGILNVFVTNPFWVIAAAVKSSRASRTKSAGKRNDASMIETTQELFAKGGVFSFWRGAGVSLILVANPIIHYFTYESLKAPLLQIAASKLRRTSHFAPNQLSNQQPILLPGWQYFMLAAIAKAVATVMTYPMQLAKTNQQAKEKANPQSPGGGYLEILRTRVEERGWGALFEGLETKMWQTVLNAAFHLVAYENIVGLVYQLLYRPRRRFGAMDPGHAL
jgi:adenine nucleotide transporter 17